MVVPQPTAQRAQGGFLHAEHLRVTPPAPRLAGFAPAAWQQEYFKRFAYIAPPLDTASPLAEYCDRCGPVLIEAWKVKEE